MMAIKANDVTVRYRAEVDKFIKNIEKVGRTTEKQNKKIAKSSKAASKAMGGMTKASGLLSKGMGSMAAKIAIVAGPTALLLLTKRALSFADAIGKTADKIGLTTSSLQELRFGAKLAGVETRTLDLAMQRFARRTGEAVKGTGELKGILDQYKIAVVNADGSTRNLDAVLDDLADTIMNAESDSEALRIAFKAFDSEGAALVNMLKEGAAGLRVFRAQAQELGIVIDEELIRGAEKANDALTILSEVIGIRLTSALIELAPHISALAEFLTEAAISSGQFFNSFKDVGDIRGLKSLEAEIVRVKELIEQLENPFIAAFAGNVGPMVDEAKARLEELNAKITEVRENAERRDTTGDVDPAADPMVMAIQARIDALARETEQLGWTAAELQLHQELMKLGIDITSELTAEQEALTGALFHQIEALQDQAEAQDALNKIQSFAESVFASTRTATEKYVAQLARLKEALDAGALDWDTYTRAVNQAKAALDRASTAAAKTAVTVNQPTRGRSTKESVTIDTSAASRALGGRVAAGITALVGERGPEIITPERSIMVTPAGPTAAMLAGGGLSFKFTIDARGAQRGAGAEFARVMAKLEASIPAIAIGAIRDAGMRAA